MNVGIVGLGLIGGSFAKAYSLAGENVLAFDVDASTYSLAQITEAVNGDLSEKTIPTCDLILLCVYPQAAIEYMKNNAEFINSDTIVIDCCGIKREVVAAGEKIAKEYGFTFVGGHPMAGTQYSGFKYAKADLFVGAPMVIVPPKFDDIKLLDKIKKLLAPAGFGSISVTTAQKHDEMIAFTSQLAHVVSSAYIKSPTAKLHKGFSAGSYKDMTRVAWLNPSMWTELFLDNSDYLVNELDALIDNLNDYKQAIMQKDSEKLYQLLLDGKRQKEEIDGK